MPDDTPRSSAPNTRRTLYGAATVAVLLALAAWATAPRAVEGPAAPVWAECFEPVALPPASPDGPGATLVRHTLLEAPVPPRLVAIIPDGGKATLRPKDRTPPDAASAAPGGETPAARGDGVQPARPEPGEVHGGQEIVPLEGVEWTVTLDEGSAELRHTDGSRFLVGPGALSSLGPARFSLRRDETYKARIAPGVAVPPVAVAANGEIVLAPGTKVEVVWSTGVTVPVRRTHRLSVAPFVLASTASALAPDIRPDREAAPYIAAGVTAPGLDLNPAKRALRACLSLDGDRPTPLPISRVAASTTGVAGLVLGLPDEALPWRDWRRGRSGILAVVDADGHYAGVGRFVYPSKPWAFAIATAITAVSFGALLWVRNADGARKRWLMGLFLGDDGQPSLSLFQILLWTIVTVWALLFVFFSTGNLVAMTQEIMVLLGFAGAGSLAARWLAVHRPAPPRKDGAQGEVRFWALLENDKGFDLFKLQLFVFTLLIALYVVFRVVRQSAFPALDAEFLLLMGVSNSLYVGSKVAQPSEPLALVQRLKVEWDVLRLQADDLEKAVEALEAQGEDLAKAGEPADPVAKRRLEDRKTALAKRIEDKKKELDVAVKRRNDKEAAYNEAVSKLTEKPEAASAPG